MNNVGSSNAPVSDTTSPTEPARQERRQATVSPRDFLGQQADEAQAAMTATLAEMQESLKDAADLDAWARQYPWPTVGAAAALGFLVAATVTPSKHSDQAAQKESLVELLEEALSDERLGRARDRGKRTLLGSLFANVLGSFVTVLQTSLWSALSARSQPAAPPSTNGAQTEAPTP
jgi:ElaB/YqjD/DUF883 family membrane-anchored ribosome-binding protein